MRSDVVISQTPERRIFRRQLFAFCKPDVVLSSCRFITPLCAETIRYSRTIYVKTFVLRSLSSIHLFAVCFWCTPYLLSFVRRSFISLDVDICGRLSLENSTCNGQPQLLVAGAVLFLALRYGTVYQGRVQRLTGLIGLSIGPAYVRPVSCWTTFIVIQ